MCTAYHLHDGLPMLAELLDALWEEESGPEGAALVRPSDPAWMVAHSIERGRVLVGSRFGFRLPGKQGKAARRVLNARSETVADKPLFARSFLSRRCVVPASAFVEWSPGEQGGRKRRWRVAREDGAPLWMLGLFRIDRSETPVTRRPSVEPRDHLSHVILTTEAQGALRNVHDRSPVIVDRAGALRWLAPLDTTQTDAIWAQCWPFAQPTQVELPALQLQEE